MKAQVRPINQTTFRILYFKYKIYFVPVGALFIALLLLLYIIFPQVQQWYFEQDKIAQAEAKIATLNRSLNTIKSMDSKLLDQNLKSATAALPSGKDFAGILNAISNSAQDSATIVGDYSFQVGDLSASALTKDTFLQIIVSLNGNVDHIRQFVTSLRDQFPISKITEIHLSENKTSSLTIVFYYKPYPKIAFTGDDVLQPLSDKELQILSSLRKAPVSRFNLAPGSLQ